MTQFLDDLMTKPSERYVVSQTSFHGLGVAINFTKLKALTQAPGCRGYNQVTCVGLVQLVVYSAAYRY